MWNFTKEQLRYLRFYWGGCLFWSALIIYDLSVDRLTGFTAGYLFALGYYVLRTKEEMDEIRRAQEDED